MNTSFTNISCTKPLLAVRIEPTGTGVGVSAKDSVFGNTGGRASGSLLDQLVPQWLFYAIIAAIPFFRWRQLPVGNIKIDWVLMGMLLLIITPLLATRHAPSWRLRSNLWTPWALFLLLNGIATLLSPYPEQAQSGMIMLLQGTVFMMVIMLMVNERGFETYLPWTIGISMAASGGMAALGYFFGVELFLHEGAKRAYGGSISANNLALMSVFTFPIGVYWAVYGHNRWVRLSGIGLAALMVLSVISTESRGGFLNLMLVASLLGLQYRKRFHPRYLGLVVGAAGVLAVLFVVATPKEFVERQLTLVEEGTQDKSVNRRSHYVKVGLEGIQERPLIGWGPDVFKKIWVNSIDTRWFDMVERPAHNTYIEVAVGAGVPGLVLFLFILLRAYLNYRQAEKMLMEHGLEEKAHLVGAVRLSIVAIALYFTIKSGLEHKYFLMSLALSQCALMYAHSVVRGAEKASSEEFDGQNDADARQVVRGALP